MAAQTLEDWVDSLQARGRYTFRRAEANDESGLSAEGVKKALQRLVGRGRVAKVKDYFYVIVPLEYRAAGAPPPSWFLHDLMEAMQLPYYVGLLSAAALHGAAHQQPQEFQVVTDRSVRPLVAGRARIRFFPLCVTQPRAQAGVASSLREYGGLRFQVCRRMPDFRSVFRHRTPSYSLKTRYARAVDALCSANCTT
jgi:hypothetical protein